MDKISSIDKLSSTPSSVTLSSGKVRGSNSSASSSDTTDATVVAGTASQSETLQTQTSTTQTSQSTDSQATSAASVKEKKEALEEALHSLMGSNTSLDFSVDKASDTVVVKIVDKTTGKVVRQIPAEEVVLMRQQQTDKTRGGLIDQVL